MMVLSSCNKYKTLTLQTNAGCCEMIPPLDLKSVETQLKNGNLKSMAIFRQLIAVEAVRKCGCIENETKKEQCFENFKLK